MRSILMFDLPVETAKNRRDYRKFVKALKKQGFIMFQESIYVKLSMNSQGVKKVINEVRKELPPKGMVSILTVTESQFRSMDMLLGDFSTDVVMTDNRYIEL